MEICSSRFLGHSLLIERECNEPQVSPIFQNAQLKRFAFAARMQQQRASPIEGSALRPCFCAAFFIAHEM